MSDELNIHPEEHDHERLTISIIEVKSGDVTDLFTCSTVTTAIDEICGNMEEYVGLAMEGVAQIQIRETDSNKEVFSTKYLPNKMTLCNRFIEIQKEDARK